MPGYGPHALVAFGGSFTEKTAGDEIWQCGVRVYSGVEGYMDTAVIDAYLAEISTALNTWFTSAGALNRNDAKLGWIKCNNILPDGKYAEPITHRYDYATPAAGAATPATPAYNCAVVSWTTAQTRGLGSRGRIYPPNSPALGTGSTMSSTSRTAILTAGKALLTAIGNQTSAVPARRVRPVIASAGNATTSVPVTFITGVRVGDVIDMHSSRRNKVPEAYISLAYP